MVEQHTLPPDSLWAVIWPTIAPALNHETVMGMVITIAITHALKQISVILMPPVTDSLTKWRAHCTMLSILTGMLVGTALWLGAGASMATVWIVAFCSGLVWRLVVLLLPDRLASALLTETDRSFKNG